MANEVFPTSIFQTLFIHTYNYTILQITDCKQLATSLFQILFVHACNYKILQITDYKQLISWSRVLQKLVATQLIKKFHNFNGT